MAELKGVEAEYYSQDNSPLGRQLHIAAVRRGALQGYKIGRRILVRADAMDEFVAAHPIAIAWDNVDDIIEHVFGEAAVVPPARIPTPWLEPLTQPTGPGVYAIQGAGAYVKIGKAKNIAERIRDIQTNHPVPLKLLSVLSENPDDENKFHRQLKEHRAHGEWFHLNAAVIKVLVAARIDRRQRSDG